MYTAISSGGEERKRNGKCGMELRLGVVKYHEKERRHKRERESKEKKEGEKEIERRARA